MFVRIEKMLDNQQLDFVDKLVRAGTWNDGTATTGAPTKSVKHNLQLEFSNAKQKEELARMVAQIINTQPTIRSVVLPRRITVPMISKYTPGMAYGWHIDNPLMPGTAGPLRSDIACTVFLSPSSAYEGGELLARSPSGDVRVKLERGDAVFYPAATRHQVTEVSRGERLALVFWIQSMVADPAKRELMYQLELAYDNLMRENPQSESLQMMQRVQANLVRMWAEV